MKNTIRIFVAALGLLLLGAGCAGTPTREGVTRFTLLPHEIENFERGRTTYQDAVKELGRPPFKAQENAGGKHVRWTDRQVSGHHTVYREVDAQFSKDGVLQDYEVNFRPVPMFGLGFR